MGDKFDQALAAARARCPNPETCPWCKNLTQRREVVALKPPPASRRVTAEKRKRTP